MDLTATIGESHTNDKKDIKQQDIFNGSHLGMYVRNLWSPIQISHGFASKLHVLHPSDIIRNWVIA